MINAKTNKGLDLLNRYDKYLDSNDVKNNNRTHKSPYRSHIRYHIKSKLMYIDLNDKEHNNKLKNILCKIFYNINGWLHVPFSDLFNKNETIELKNFRNNFFKEMFNNYPSETIRFLFNRTMESVIFENIGITQHEILNIINFKNIKLKKDDILYLKELELRNTTSSHFKDFQHLINKQYLKLKYLINDDDKERILLNGFPVGNIKQEIEYDRLSKFFDINLINGKKSNILISLSKKYRNISYNYFLNNHLFIVNEMNKENKMQFLSFLADNKIKDDVMTKNQSILFSKISHSMLEKKELGLFNIKVFLSLDENFINEMIYNQYDDESITSNIDEKIKSIYKKEILDLNVESKLILLISVSLKEEKNTNNKMKLIEDFKNLLSDLKNDNKNKVNELLYGLDILKEKEKKENVNNYMQSNISLSNIITRKRL